MIWHLSKNMYIHYFNQTIIKKQGAWFYRLLLLKWTIIKDENSCKIVNAPPEQKCLFTKLQQPHSL